MQYTEEVKGHRGRGRKGEKGKRRKKAIIRFFLGRNELISEGKSKKSPGVQRKEKKKEKEGLGEVDRRVPVPR